MDFFAISNKPRAMRPDLIILGDYNPEAETHLATDAAICHCLAGRNTDLATSWISTETIREADIVQAHGLWVAPGSPYKNLQRALEAIRLAREHLVPSLGTCGGFQHMVLEFARNVLGFADASHAEYDPGASRLFVSPLGCSVKGKELRVKLCPQTTVRSLYRREEAFERYYCSFGINPEYSEILAGHRNLVVSGRDLNGEIRIIEILNHPFFVGTLFVPQMQSTEEKPHPLVSGFLQAVLRHRDRCEN